MMWTGAAEAASSAAPWRGVRHGQEAVAVFFACYRGTEDTAQAETVLGG